MQFVHIHFQFEPFHPSNSDIYLTEDMIMDETIFKAYDRLSCIDHESDQRYLYFILEKDIHLGYDIHDRDQFRCNNLWCFDKMNKEFIKLKGSEQSNDYFKDIFAANWLNVNGFFGGLDMVQYKNELILSGINGYVDDEIIAYKTTLPHQL